MVTLGSGRWSELGLDALLRVLRCRFGDGSIYLEEIGDWPIYQAAQTLGLITGDGYLTRAGRRLLSVHSRD